MARVKHHPKNTKACALCKYWTGDAKPVFVNPMLGFEYEDNARGKCMKMNTSRQSISYCNNFAPSIEAEKLL